VSALGDRSQAIDIMRGMTIAVMIIVNTSSDEATAYAPLLHASWNGLTLADMVFPAFLFVVGASLSITLEKYQSRGSAATWRRIATRSVLIFLCGYLLSWLATLQTDAGGHWTIASLAHTRVLGVLQRIALCYGCAALIVGWSGRTGALVGSFLILLGYWWLMHRYGDYSLNGNAAVKIDRLLLGADRMRLDQGAVFDSEGLTSTVPAIVNVLVGYLAGCAIRARQESYGTVMRLAVAGALGIAVSLLWASVFPINKKIWTSSYALCNGGIDLVLLALLCGLVRWRMQQGWGRFFEIFGRNALFIYLFTEVGNTLVGLVQVGGDSAFSSVNTNSFQSWAGEKPGSLVLAIACMLACWLVAWVMDLKRIYLRL
jgi:predicted acyltransferase